MADDVLDGGQAVGTNQDANPGGSDGNGVQQLSNVATQLQASLDTLTSKVGELDARTRTLQGDKDKGVQKALNEVGDLRSKIADYENLKERLGADGAVEQIAMRDTLRAIQAQLEGSQPVSTQPVGNEVSGAVNMANAVETLQAMKLDANDAGFLELVQKGLTQENLNAYIVNKLKPSPTASPAGIVNPPATGGTPSPTTSDLTQEYMNKMQAAQGNPSLVKSLMEEYSKKGVDLGTVVFH